MTVYKHTSPATAWYMSDCGMPLWLLVSTERVERPPDGRGVVASSGTEMTDFITNLLPVVDPNNCRTLEVLHAIRHTLEVIRGRINFRPRALLPPPCHLLERPAGVSP